MKQASGRVGKWKIAAKGFGAIEDGLILTYRRARRTMVAAYDDPTPANFHEWRKQAKYHSFHLTLLRGLWEPVMNSLSKESDDLADVLGDDHNLEVLHQTLLTSPKKFGKKRDIQVLLGVIDRRSAELRVDGNRIGTRIFVEKPNVFGQRFSAYWDVWRSEAKLPSKKLTEEPAVVTAIV